MTFKSPKFKTGYVLNDELQVVYEVRAYVRDESFMKDPMGHLDGWIVGSARKGGGNTLHHTDYFKSDDKNLIRAKSRRCQVAV